MIKNLKVLMPCILILIFICCKMDSSETVHGNGTLRISIAMPQSRGLSSLESATAAAVANHYELYVYNGQEFISAIIEMDTGSTLIPVPEGTYTVLAIGGWGNNSRAVMLGSATREAVVIQKDTITTVVIQLLPVSYQIDAPETVTILQPYQIEAAGDTNNSRLFVTINGTRMENRPYIEISGSTTKHYLECENDGSRWTGRIQLNAPLTSGQAIIRLFGSNIKLKDSAAGIDADLHTIGKTNWCWLYYRTTIPEQLLPLLNKDISFENPETALEIELGW